MKNKERNSYGKGFNSNSKYDKDIRERRKEKYKSNDKSNNQSKRKIATKKMELKLKGNIICLLDCEADRNKAISIGAVIVNNISNEVLETFYRTIRPKSFNGLDSFTKRYTGLTNQDIDNSPSFKEVYTEFETLLKRYGVVDLLSWGNGDKDFLTSCGKSTYIIKNIINIQPIIGMETSPIIQKNLWGLKDIKYFYDIDSNVTHNALSDALDLYNVYIRWKDNAINIDRVKEYKNALDEKESEEEVV